MTAATASWLGPLGRPNTRSSAMPAKKQATASDKKKPAARTVRVRPVPAVSRSIAILRLLGQVGQPLGVKAIADELALVPSTCLHILRVLVGEERHDTVDLALRYLGLGAPEPVPADEQGRIRVDALADALGTYDGPTILALQAGNVHSGAFDDFAAAIPLAHENGAWVHVDGAFGLWAAASPTTQHLTAGLHLADSWATDAHKTLNVPYDSGLAFVADSTTHRAALGIHAPYLIHSQGPPDPLELGPEFSQRGRAFPLWATLQYLGTDGVAGLVDRMAGHAQAFADGVRALGGEVLNDVVFTQVCTAWGDDATTAEVERLLLADGAAWMTGSTWQGRKVLRIAVSNHSTTDDDVRRALEALGKAYDAAR